MTNKYEDFQLPNYRNTREVYAGLDVSDLAKAAALGGLGLLIIGRPGTGKSQLMYDFHYSWYGGNMKDGGQGIFIRGNNPELDIYDEIFTELNIEKAKRTLTKNINAMSFSIDEINRLPTKQQNQFLGLGDGRIDYKGSSVKLGREGYRAVIATANFGNGEHQGTYEMDSALLNRSHIVLDFDYNMFSPTEEDEFEIDRMKIANPNIKDSPARDISDKILLASKEIDALSQTHNLETLAAVNYLRFGLKNCQKNGTKERVWPLECPECPHNNPEKNALCSLVREPVRRTLEATIRYAVALNYLAKLKNPGQKIEPAELIFRSFELTGAYQGLLNQQILRQNYKGQAPKFMAEVVKQLKEDFKENEDYIISCLEEAEKNGKSVTKFFEYNGQIGNYDSLSEKSKKKVKGIEPFHNEREIGLSFVPILADNLIKLKNTEKENEETK